MKIDHSLHWHASNKNGRFFKKGHNLFLRRACTFLLLAGSVSVHGLEVARMEMPEGFAEQAEILAAKGFGGHNKGSYSLGGYKGKFTRGESRLGIFDPLYVSSKGKSTFTFQESGVTGKLTAECQLKKGTVTVGIVTFDPKKMTYHCEFRRGGSLLGASFVLGQPKPDSMKERFLANAMRRGEAVIMDHHFKMQSVHKFKGSALQSQVPVGYLLESGDRTIGAVELTDWNPTVYLLPDMPADLRESALIVALAVAILRDPADSALDE